MAFFDLVRKLRGGDPARPAGYPKTVDDLPPWAREFVEEWTSTEPTMTDAEIEAFLERKLEDPSFRAELEKTSREVAEHRRQRRRELGLD